MMKKLITLAMVAIIAVSCVEDDDFSVPETAPTAVDLEGTFISLNDLYSAMAQDEFLSMYEADSDAYTSGYVVSTDEGGNFFEEIYIQDSPTSPSRGARIVIDNNPLFTRYNVGRKVFIKLAGLTVTSSTEPENDFNGNLENGDLLGMNIGKGSTVGRIEQISAANELTTILRDSETATIEPNLINIADFNSTTLYTAIRLENVQFDSSNVGLTYAGEPTDQFDGERLLTECGATVFSSSTALFQTSTFADYRSLQLPVNRGSMDALLGTDFFGENFVVTVNSPESIDFDNTDRCDLPQFSCGAGTPGANTLLFENFETQFTGQTAMPAGWTNVQEDGTRTWEVYTSGGANASLGKSVRVGSRNSNDSRTVAWLITPELDFDTQTGENISFETSNSFSDNSTMVVLYADDYDGTDAGVLTANWQVLADADVVRDDEFFGNWVFSGNASLDCAAGTGHIAFRYQGFDQDDNDGTYELDNISVTSN